MVVEKKSGSENAIIQNLLMVENHAQDPMKKLLIVIPNLVKVIDLISIIVTSTFLTKSSATLRETSCEQVV